MSLKSSWATDRARRSSLTSWSGTGSSGIGPTCLSGSWQSSTEKESDAKHPVVRLIMKSSGKAQSVKTSKLTFDLLGGQICNFFRVKKHQYGQTQEWVYGLNLIYTSLHQEQREEFRICDFSCLLSSAGGYIGLFFGISILDLIFSLEWIICRIYSNCIKRTKKKQVKEASIQQWI